MSDEATHSLEQLLGSMDRAAANLAKLDEVWKRAQPHIPTGPAGGSNREYDDLCRHWQALLPGLPPIDGWRVTAKLPDIDAAGRAFIDYLEMNEIPFALHNELEGPGRDLDEYRFRLAQARRKATRDRIEELTIHIDKGIDAVLDALPSGTDRVDNEHTALVETGFREIHTLLGDTTERRGRWWDMSRHLRFSEPHDWRDIHDVDWPDIKATLATSAMDEFDPLSVKDFDLGLAASSRPEGGVSVRIGWGRVDDDGFERLLFDLLRGLSGYQNVQWLMKTRAPDRGRDLSVERAIADAAGTVRTERVIVQAKHWTSKSVRPADVQEALASLSLWEPPAIRSLVIATSARFTADAVAVIEKHNHDGKMPLIEMWPDSQLEAMLATRPDLIAEHNLRDDDLEMGP